MTSSDPQPVVKHALSSSWESLDRVVREHYDMTPGTPSSIIIQGTMSEVYHSNIAKLFLLPGRIFGALVPYKGKQISTEVKNWTTQDNHQAMFWYRTMHFPGKAPVTFKSRMEHTTSNEIIEFVKYGLGLRLLITVENGALIFKSKGYIWNIGNLSLHIPNWMILGDAQITEKAISDTEFFIDFDIQHPLFGKTFSYSGIFKIIK